jgi:hypothetical protein
MTEEAMERALSKRRRLSSDAEQERLSLSTQAERSAFMADCFSKLVAGIGFLRTPQS